MKKKIIIMTLLSIGLVVEAQSNLGKVGINTESPSATLDIQSNGTDGTTKALEINNSATSSKEMVTVLNNGNVGFNQPTPTTKVDILTTSGEGTGFKLVDGSQAFGQVLTSDANGAAHWDDLQSITSYGFSAQSKVAQTFNVVSFQAFTTPSAKQEVTWRAEDLIITDAADLVAVSNDGFGNYSQFQVKRSGIYDVFSSVNLLISGNEIGGTTGMGVNISVEKFDTATSSWITISGNRHFRPSNFSGIAQSLMTQALVPLQLNDILRVTIFRGNGGFVTSANAPTTIVSTGNAVNGVAYTKSIKLVRLRAL